MKEKKKETRLTEFENEYDKETEEILKRDEWKNWDGIIHIDMSNINKIQDIRFRNFLMNWYSRNFMPGDLVTVHDIGWAVIEYYGKRRVFKTRLKAQGEVISFDDNFVYPEVEEMIDYCINNCQSKFRDNYIKLKKAYKGFGLMDEQLELFLKPSYRKIKRYEK